MSEGYGRHNSNLGDRNSPMPETPGLLPYQQQYLELLRQQQSRVIGRLGSGDIQANMAQCTVGDAVLCDDPDPPNKIFTFVPPIYYVNWTEEPRFQPVEKWHFEHVSLRVTPDNGLTW